MTKIPSASYKLCHRNKKLARYFIPFIELYTVQRGILFFGFIKSALISKELTEKMIAT